MNEAVEAMLDFLRDERALKKHVADALIAQQEPWPYHALTRAQWLKKCERVAAARDRMADQRSVTP